MGKWRQVAGAIGFALLLAWEGSNGVDAATPDIDVDESIDFDIPQQPLRTAVEAFARQTGGDTYIGREVFDACGELTVGPLVGRMTLQDAWTRLAAPICAASGVVVEGQGTVPVFMMDHPWVRARDIDIPRGRLHEVLLAVSDRFGALSLTFHFNRQDEAQILVGPIQGHMTPEEVLTLIEHQAGVELAPHPSGQFAFSLGASDPETPSKYRISYARPCSCPPRVVEPLREKVLVVGRGIAAPADQRGLVRFSRSDIEATGAATLPEFFRYLARNAHSRHAGYIASGAQYADFRGLGRDTHLVTINGRRTLPSANNVTSSAFDLNTIPLSAVEHVDIHYDSASLRYGSDAIAGTIDIITRRQLDELALEQRYGIAAGGAEQWRTTLSLGGRRGAVRFAATLDHLELGDLLGHERAISRDQDYRPYGGLDYRASFGIRSLDGADLPGLNAPMAGLPEARDSDDVSISDLTAGEPQRISLSKYQSLVPAGRRTSFVGAADFQWRDIEVSADALLVSRDSQYDYHPAIASGIVGAEHPGSPFDEEVWIDALLSGAPSMQQHVDSELRRMVLSARGNLRDWNWDLAALRSDEAAKAWADHTLDPMGTAMALQAANPSSALDVFAIRPGQSAPSTVWASPDNERFSSSGRHLLASVEGGLGTIGSGEVRLQLGLEHRDEEMLFSSEVGRVQRDVSGRFAHLVVPLIQPELHVFGVNGLTALAGARRDVYSDTETVSREHFELRWNITDRWLIEANVAEQYRPPSLFELNLPPVTLPVQIYDRKREEAVPVAVTVGGNPNLLATEGASTNIQASYSSPDGLVVSANYFSVRLWDRISMLPLQALLAHEEQFPGRVQRAAPTPDDVAAQRPGRITSLDLTRINIGGLFSAGVDVSVQKSFQTRYGSFNPRLDVTWTDAFRYLELTSPGQSMIDRVGIASEQGSITRWRAVASVGWQKGAWSAATHLRLAPPYEDTGGQRIGSQALWDLNVSYSPRPSLTLTFGAVDITNTSPPFANIGAAMGFDSSQFDPVGRRFIFSAKVSR